jgi:hypothetical protein
MADREQRLRNAIATGEARAAERNLKDKEQLSRRAQANQALTDFVAQDLPAAFGDLETLLTEHGKIFTWQQPFGESGHYRFDLMIRTRGPRQEPVFRAILEGQLDSDWDQVWTISSAGLGKQALGASVSAQAVTDAVLDRYIHHLEHG